jgi:hypothetical protein
LELLSRLELPNLFLTKEVLYQLSYNSMVNNRIIHQERGVCQAFPELPFADCFWQADVTERRQWQQDIRGDSGPCKHNDSEESSGTIAGGRTAFFSGGSRAGAKR